MKIQSLLAATITAAYISVATADVVATYKAYDLLSSCSTSDPSSDNPSQIYEVRDSDVGQCLTYNDIRFGWGGVQLTEVHSPPGSTYTLIVYTNNYCNTDPEDPPGSVVQVEALQCTSGHRRLRSWQLVAE